MTSTRPVTSDLSDVKPSEIVRRPNCVATLESCSWPIGFSPRGFEMLILLLPFRNYPQLKTRAVTVHGVHGPFMCVDVLCLFLGHDIQVRISCWNLRQTLEHSWMKSHYFYSAANHGTGGPRSFWNFRQSSLSGGAMRGQGTMGAAG